MLPRCPRVYTLYLYSFAVPCSMFCFVGSYPLSSFTTASGQCLLLRYVVLVKNTLSRFSHLNIQCAVNLGFQSAMNSLVHLMNIPVIFDSVESSNASFKKVISDGNPSVSFSSSN